MDSRRRVKRKSGKAVLLRDVTGGGGEVKGKELPRRDRLRQYCRNRCCDAHACKPYRMRIIGKYNIIPAFVKCFGENRAGQSQTRAKISAQQECWLCHRPGRLVAQKISRGKLGRTARSAGQSERAVATAGSAAAKQKAHLMAGFNVLGLISQSPLA